MLKAEENVGPLYNSRDITYHKGDEQSCPSLVGSLSGGHWKKRYFSQGIKWKRHCQDISLIWPGIRRLHEPQWDATWAAQKESWQNLLQLEVSEIRDTFVSSTPPTDLPQRAQLMPVYLYGDTFSPSPHAPTPSKGTLHKSPSGLAFQRWLHSFSAPLSDVRIPTSLYISG